MIALIDFLTGPMGYGLVCPLFSLLCMGRGNYLNGTLKMFSQKIPISSKNFTNKSFQKISIFKIFTYLRINQSVFASDAFFYWIRLLLATSKNQLLPTYYEEHTKNYPNSIKKVGIFWKLT